MADLKPVEQLSLLVTLLGLPFYVAGRVARKNLLRANSRGDSWRRVAFDSMIRYATGRLSIRQMKSLSQPTRAGFAKYLKETRTEGSIEEIGESAALLWLGARAQGGRTLLYFHGGGYLFPASPMHFSFLAYLRAEYARIAEQTLNVAILEYSLAPEHQFPTQLRQASAALAHLLDTGVPAGDIIIGGDSAGGNLALTLLSHLQHPHPDLPPVPLAAPLSGAFVVSPGVSRDVQGIPMRTEDSVHPRAYVNWYAAAPGGDVGVWSGASALFAADGWWAPLAAVTRRVLVTTGSAEAFSSRQIAFAQRLLVESPGTQVECVEEEGAVHISPISDLAALGDGPGKAAKHIAQWVAAV